ncbi:MAG: hypothetical protein NTU90_08270 [Proteobacteria bacterium]|jgi:hypothetical protein|nr:hypothetical protein [Pseudomonadota bacterium]
MKKVRGFFGIFVIVLFVFSVVMHSTVFAQAAGSGATTTGAAAGTATTAGVGAGTIAAGVVGAAAIAAGIAAASGGSGTTTTAHH